MFIYLVAFHGLALDISLADDRPMACCVGREYFHSQLRLLIVFRLGEAATLNFVQVK